jgi:hypothetical protein
MSHHAYYFAGDSETGVAAALLFAEQERGLIGTNNPDITIQRFGLFSVEDARKISDIACRAPLNGSQKIIIIATPRLFEQAQNALLKICEEPPVGVTVVLIIPTEGILLPTLRSRLLLLPTPVAKSHITNGTTGEIDAYTQKFIAGNVKEKAAMVAKLIEQSKSDSDDTKQAARASAIALIEGMTRFFYAKRKTTNDGMQEKELTAFLRDLNRFMPLMHTRSAPLKLIFEHVLIVFPHTIDGSSVV